MTPPPKDWRSKYKTEPFPSVGVWVSFYYEGGHGDSYWSGGWRVGKIMELPIKGQHKGWARIELVPGYKVEVGPRTWAHLKNVNRLGDTVYHGPKLIEVVAEMERSKGRSPK